MFCIREKFLYRLWLSSFLAFQTSLQAWFTHYFTASISRLEMYHSLELTRLAIQQISIVFEHRLIFSRKKLATDLLGGSKNHRLLHVVASELIAVLEDPHTLAKGFVVPGQWQLQPVWHPVGQNFRWLFPPELATVEGAIRENPPQKPADCGEEQNAPSHQPTQDISNPFCWMENEKRKNGIHQLGN